MPLEPGARLGPYEIQTSLGAGGMGEVYTATDTRLDRTVAIKVLPSELAADPERRERFEREAKTISSLNHPHICSLFDVGQQDGIDFLVMEHLEGETLADRLTKSALPLDQALRYAIEIADALDKAHRQGIVHRDLKPGNIMLTKAGAKLLDFGLAKLRGLEEQAGLSQLSAQATLDQPLTQQGTILGTFQYMAPEQIEGQEADARTDIWAFGGVLYVMVTGKRAFVGKSQASLIGAILEREPAPISSIEAMSPLALDHLVNICLAKDPENRWQSARDVTRELQWIAEGDSPVAGTAAPPRAGWRHTRPLTLSALVVGAVLAGVAVWSTTRPEPAFPRPPSRFAVTVPDGVRLPSNQGIALSPDGQALVFPAGTPQQLFRRRMRELAVEPIRGTEGGIRPFFSPDGQWVGFFTRHLVWVDRDGRMTPLTDTRDHYAFPRVSPDGARVAVAVGKESVAGGAADIWLYEIERGSRTRLTFSQNSRCYFPVWTPDGSRVAHGLTSDSFDLFWTPADGTGQSEPLLTAPFAQLPFSWAPDGRTLAFYEIHPDTRRDIWMLPLEGDRPPNRFS